jgi:cell division protein FtsA
MRRNIVTGIDVGTNITRVVIAELSSETGTPRVIGMGFAESRGLRSGYVTNMQEATRSISTAIAHAEEEAGVRIRSVFLSIGGISLEAITNQDSIMISRADNEVTDLDVEKVITTTREKARLINKQVIETIPLSYKIDGKEIYGRPVGIKGTKLEIKMLFITAFEQHVADLIQATEDAGVEVEDIIPAPIAASLIALTKRQRAVGCLLANIGAETVSIAVFEEDIPVSLEVFPIGSTDITNDIALGFQIPLEEAESLKKGGVKAFERKKLEEIIEARLSDIFELIESHLKKIGRNGLLPAGIILTGGGAGISTIEDFAKGTLMLPSKVARLPLNEGEPIQDSSWFVAYGLCIFGLNQARETGSSQRFKSAGKNILSWFKQLLP